MDIGAISKGKYKVKGKGKHKGKKGKKGNKGKGYGGSTSTGKLQFTVNRKRKRKGWARNALQRTTTGKSYSKSTGQGKGQGICYKCGQPGHTVKNSRVSVYNINDGTQGNEQSADTTQSHHYDSHWWNTDQSSAQQQQATTHAEQASSSTTVPLIHIAAIRIANTGNAAQALQHNNKINDLMVDSGAVTHVCPPWFSPETTLHTLRQGEGPDLRTATDDNIRVYGYKWIFMIISFYVFLTWHNQSCQQQD